MGMGRRVQVCSVCLNMKSFRNVCIVYKWDFQDEPLTCPALKDRSSPVFLIPNSGTTGRPRAREDYDEVDTSLLSCYFRCCYGRIEENMGRGIE